MTRTKLFLFASGLLGLVVWASNAWTQDGPARDPNLRGDERPSADAARDEREIEISVSPPAVPATPAPPIGPRGGLPLPLGFGRAGSGMMRPKTVLRTVSETIVEAVPPEELEEFQKFQQAKQTLKDAKNEADKQKAAETIRRSLEKQFERDLAQREQDVAALEERIKSLRQQLGKRQASKDEIIALRLKTIMNSAEGLGFPGDDGPSGDPLLAPRPVSFEVRDTLDFPPPRRPASVAPVQRVAPAERRVREEERQERQ